MTPCNVSCSPQGSWDDRVLQEVRLTLFNSIINIKYIKCSHQPKMLGSDTSAAVAAVTLARYPPYLNRPQITVPVGVRGFTQDRGSE